MRVRLNGFRDGNDWYWYHEDENDYDYKYGVTYVMKENGLYTLDGTPSNKNNDWNDNSDELNQNRIPPENDSSYRYNNNSNRIDSLKNVQEKQIQKMQSAVDSMKSAREKDVQKMKDSLRKAKEEIDQRIENLNKGTAMHSDEPSANAAENYSFIMNI